MIGRVSVVIPSYNASRFLGEAVESVLNQTVPPEQVVVVDDGSTDDTASVVRSFGRRVLYVRQSNAGPAAARNAGIQRCSESLVAFQDADDIWEPTKLATQFAYLSAHPEFAAVYSDLSEVDENGTVLIQSKFSGSPGAGAEGTILEEILLCGFMFMQTLLVKRSVFSEIGGFDEGLRSSEDRDFAIRMASKFSVGCIRLSLTRRRRHATNISNDFMNLGLRTDVLALEKALEQIGMDGALAQRVRRHLGGLYIRLGRFDLGRGDRIRARRALIRAIRVGGRFEAMALVPLAFAPHRLLSAGARLRRLTQVLPGDRT